MPFGHERKEIEKRKEASSYESKIESQNFIEVTALMRNDGVIIPLSFIWEDREIKIERVLNVRPGSSLKDKVAATRFLCVAMNRRFYLYFTGKQWYID